MNKFFLLAFVLAGSLLHSVDANQNVALCESTCEIAVEGISCSDLLAQYRFQGSCCSLTERTSHTGCLVQVGGGSGSCYWYPKCGECDPNAGDWNKNPCGKLYQAAEGTTCPAGEFPTFWGSIDKPTFHDGPWNDYSCAPSAAPVVAPTRPPSASASISVRALALFGMIVALAQM